MDQLTCKRKQELVGADEIRVTVDGREVFSRKMEKGDSVPCDNMKTFDAGDVVAVAVEEQDGRRYRPIGPVQHVSSGEAGSSQQERDFSTSGAHYVLSCEVTA